MTATQDAESKYNEWKATVIRYKKEYDSAQHAVDEQRKGIRFLELSLKEINRNGYKKGMRKDELETVIRKAEERLVGFEERAEAYSSRLKLADPKRELMTIMRDQAREDVCFKETSLTRGKGKWSWQW